MQLGGQRLGATARLRPGGLAAKIGESMTATVKCPSCGRGNASGNFCSWCAARLDATSAETEVMGAAAGSASRISISSTTVDEGRFLPGTVLAGRYRIAGLLGRGGMGEVYRATYLTLAHAVVLQFL